MLCVKWYCKKLYCVKWSMMYNKPMRIPTTPSMIWNEMKSKVEILRTLTCSAYVKWDPGIYSYIFFKFVFIFSHQHFLKPAHSINSFLHWSDGLVLPHPEPPPLPPSAWYFPTIMWTPSLGAEAMAQKPLEQTWAVSRHN